MRVMSARAIFIAVGVLAALGLIAWVVTPRNAGDAGRRAPMLEFSPSDVRGFVIERPGTASEHVWRGPFGWTFSSLDAHGSTDAIPVWPIDAAQPRALLSVLGALVPVADAGVSAMPADYMTLRLQLADGGERTLALAPTSVGGRRLARADDGPIVTIDKDIYEALTAPGPRGWRETRVFRSVGAETSRITIEQPGLAIELARVQGRWSMRSPVRAPADEEAVARLLDDLANLRITEWADRGNIAEIIYDRPFLRVRVERDRAVVDSDGSRAVDTDAEVFAVFGHIDLAGAQRFAIVGEPGGPAIVDALTLGRVLPLADSLVSRAAVESHSSRIAEIRIEADRSAARVYRRTLDGWRSDTGGAPADEAANELLSLLTVEVCDDVMFDAGRATEPIASVRLIGFDGGDLAAVTVARDAGGLIVTTGGVHRRYERASVPEALSP